MSDEEKDDVWLHCVYAQRFDLAAERLRKKGWTYNGAFWKTITQLAPDAVRRGVDALNAEYSKGEPDVRRLLGVDP